MSRTTRSRPRLGLAVATAALLAGTGAMGASAQDAQLDVDEIDHSANIEHLTNLPDTGAFDAPGAYGTDLAFQDGKAFVGNYVGFTVYDIADPQDPSVITRVHCPGSQNDISVHGDLLFLSTDSSRSDDSCNSTAQSAADPTSWEGMKIFDISDLSNPRYVKSVETPCGSHTHTLVPSKNGKNVYVYVSSYGPRASFPDCQPPHDSIAIIDVPMADPTAAELVAQPDLFAEDGGGYTNTSGCHDITAFPDKNIAAGACMGDGIILDIRNPVAPKVIERVRDTQNFAFWHSATFNQKARKVVFTDELGGGGAATCNAAIGPNRGANAIYDLSPQGQLSFKSYFKIPRHQGETENCVAHNGSLIPVKNKDLMVQAWYQGGLSVWDFTDSENPEEIAYFERGPLDDEALALGGAWSAYYYNGHVFSSDIVKGFDVLKINDQRVKGAEKVRMNELNVQTQPKYVGNGN